MAASHPPSTFTHRRTHRVRGPRPYSWLSSPSSNEYRDVWPWTTRSSNLSRGSTLRSIDSSDSSISSLSSYPVHTPDALIECDDKPYCHHGRRRKPAGPRAPRNGPCFDVRRLGLWIETSQSAISPLQREISPMSPVFIPGQSTDALRSPQIPSYTVISSPTNFLLDWDAIFELLGCSEGRAQGAADSYPVLA